MEKVKIHYSSSREIKDYLESIAERYNMTLSGVMTMIIMQHKFQNETLDKFNEIQGLLGQLDINNPDSIVLSPTNDSM
jgi:uncharacterized pyridoxal phosphate-containing UPF0001 family protein